jgi:four helix bundle protein
VNEKTETIYRRMVVFGSNVIRLTDHLPRSQGGRIVAGQVCRSSTSIGANYREAQRARTKKEFVSKLQISLQESDETIHWLEVIRQAGFATPDTIGPLLQEANELAAILVTSVRTSKSRV